MAIKDLVPKFNRVRDRALATRSSNDPLLGFHREMDRLFDEFFGDFLPATRRGGWEAQVSGFNPRVDVSETDKEVKISAELPGLDEKDIAVEMDEGSVTIRGEKKEEKEDKTRNWHVREQYYGSFHRVIPLPAGVDAAKAGAKFSKGVLTITAPKVEEEHARRKTIKITAG